jgi:hypothetical protein
VLLLDNLEAVLTVHSQWYVKMKPDKNKLQLDVQAATRKHQQICWELALNLSKQTRLLRVHPAQIFFYLKLNKRTPISDLKRCNNISKRKVINQQS